MGRKSTLKKRINDPKKKLEWAALLLPAFQQRGLKKFNMDEVAAYLGVSKATLYKYFSSREEVLMQMLQWKIAEIAGFRSQLKDETLPFPKRFFNAIQLASKQLTGISTLFLKDLKLLHPTVWNHIMSFMEQTVDDLQQFYKEGIEKGAFEPIHPAILAATDQLFFTNVADPEFLSSHQLSMDEAVKAYFTLKFGGILRRSASDALELERLMQGMS